MTGGGNEMHSARIFFAQVPFGNIFTPNSGPFVCLSKGNSADGHVQFKTRCSLSVGWLSCLLGFCSLLNHLTKEKGGGKIQCEVASCSQLSAAAWAAWYFLIRNLWLPGQLASTSLEVLDGGKAKGESCNFLRNCASAEPGGLHHLDVSC